MLSAALLLLLSQDPPPVFEPPPPTPNPDTSRLPRTNEHRQVAIVSGRVAIAGEGRLPDKALVQLLCPGSAPASVMTLDRFNVPFAPGAQDAVQHVTSCQVHVSLSGYLPAVKQAAAGDVGLILLQPRPEAKGFSYSATSLFAPEAARKRYERGLELAQRGKRNDARVAWESAVKEYPKYAAAWLQLGVLHQAEKRFADARRAYEQAWDADKKYLLPLLHLASLAATERDWKRTADLSDQLILLNPIEFPEAYLYNAAAFFNLGHATPAEQAARRAIELDPMHRYPRSHQLLGMILEARGDRAGAAAEYRAFLQHASKSPEAESVKARLAALTL